MPSSCSQNRSTRQPSAFNRSVRVTVTARWRPASPSATQRFLWNVASGLVVPFQRVQTRWVPRLHSRRWSHRLTATQRLTPCPPSTGGSPVFPSSAIRRRRSYETACRGVRRPDPRTARRLEPVHQPTPARGRRDRRGDSAATKYSTLLEYELPLDFRRPDVVLLVAGGVVVVELKGKADASQADIDQVASYARDLRCYHRDCESRGVVPVLVPTRRSRTSSGPERRPSRRPGRARRGGPRVQFRRTWRGHSGRRLRC